MAVGRNACQTIASHVANAARLDICVTQPSSVPLVALGGLSKPPRSGHRFPKNWTPKNWIPKNWIFGVSVWF